MTEARPIPILSFSAADIVADSGGLGALLHACVHAGASVGFVLPFSPADSEAFWQTQVRPAVAAGTRRLLVIRQDGRIAGAVQLDHDTPPNQPHRVEVRKLLVHPDFRRRGIARALMLELERIVRTLGRSLITLDTRSGGAAEPLYAALGFRTVGVIPAYAVDPIDPCRVDSTTVMYKIL